jgi:bifunctional aspartokinase / homoserine dehydrogenase 1
MRILKFGGSSVGTSERIRNVGSIIASKSNKNTQIAVVVSAFQGVTDKLISLSEQAAQGKQEYKEALQELCTRHLQAVKDLLPLTQQSSALATVRVWLNDLEDILHGVYLVGEYSKRMLDYIMSFGERISAYVIAAHLTARGLKANFLDAREIIKADETYGAARVSIHETYNNVKEYFKKNSGLHIVTGFIGSTQNNDTITLGRGGSDYTAALLGAALSVDEIEIWTDVDGVMTADPRKVPKAFFIPTLTYEEMMELSHFGAKVIYPPTIQPALNARIPVSIRNTFNPDFEGTRISEFAEEHPFLITGISSIEHIALLRVQGSGMVGVAGVSMRLFGALARREINVILITQASSEHTVCFAVEPNAAADAKMVIEKEFALEISSKLIDEVVIEKELSIVSVVGENMRHTPGISAKLFGALGYNGINIVAIAQGSSELNISVVIQRNDERKALNALHDEFFITQTKSVNIFIVGTGLIGSTLIKQIKEQAVQLKLDLSLDLKVVGLLNRKRALLDEAGVKLDDIELASKEVEQFKDIQAFVEKMKALNLPNTIFVDCTASDEVTDFYESILASNIAIVTPNKRAQTRDFAMFQRLKEKSKKHAVRFLYETSVGAGLPVISTLNDLIRSGDEIRKIEAVLSGTLSFIYNSFDGTTSFSEVVKEAKRLGYTEPDPRDDLCGADVARKLLILARESGLALESKDVKVQNLVPESCRAAKSIEEFFTLLHKEDKNLDELINKVKKEAKKLCYIGKIEDGKAEVSLQSIDANHPFYGLTGSDNIISFTTKRYNTRPLVVKGPGAGAEVTAAGVFADIIRVASQR